ncbi:MAG TPA: hypothetical protein DCG79_04210 [Clostridiales bacterium]|nr:hypothetical protein [Clostridiales bacterium]
MNIEKQTYYNTELLQQLFEKRGKAVACYGTLSRLGGVRFHLGAQTKVVLEVRFHSMGTQASIRLDGDLLAKTSYRTSRFEVDLPKGDHVFEAESTSHGGFVIEAEGAGLTDGARYFDRVGGHASEDETVVYMANGDSKAIKYCRVGSTLQRTILSSPTYDDAYLYDKSGGAYTSTIAYVTAVDGRSKMLLHVNADQLVEMGKVESLAICDGRTLGTGADYLVGCVHDGGTLTFFRAGAGIGVGSSARCDWDRSALRVVSAQQGSVLIVQGKNYVWTALHFHPQGQKSLVFTGCTLRYDEIPLCKNKYVAPSAGEIDQNGVPVFYCKREDGKLVRKDGEQTTELGWQEAYHPGVVGGFWQYAGEVDFESAE